jgi:SAM-dependent methyltransferase
MSSNGETPGVETRQREQAAEFFSDAWSIYTRVLQQNYMFHDEIYRDVSDFLRTCSAHHPLSLLDLGCGSALHLSRALEGVPMTRYVGCDLSATALASARDNLGSLGCRVELLQEDLLSALRRPLGRFDVIFSSFAVHHLQFDEKADFFRLASAALAPAGKLVLIDVLREENEARETYLDRYCGWILSEWQKLDSDSLQQICEHIRTKDFPETASSLNHMAAEAGLIEPTPVNRFLFHHTLSWERTAD